MRVASKIKKWRRLPWSLRLAVIESIIFLCLAKFYVSCFSFEKIAARLGIYQKESVSVLPNDVLRAVLPTMRILTAVARQLPFSCLCLPQALAGQWMLSRRKIPSTLYLGLYKQDSVNWVAHAWLRCGDEIVTGKAGYEQFSVVALFGKEFT